MTAFRNPCRSVNARSPRCRNVLRTGTHRCNVIRNNPALPREQPIHAVEGVLRRRRELRWPGHTEKILRASSSFRP
jgi:hypothetical protein